MPSTYTNNLGIQKPGSGEQSGTWGDTVNTNSDIIDVAINGVLSLSLSGTSSTLITSDGTLSNGQYKVLVLTGSPSGTHTITISPSDAQKFYLVHNTTAQSVVFTQGSGGDVTVAASDSSIIYSTGIGATSAVVSIADHLAMSSVKITGGAISGITDLAVADGGTGASDAATARANLGAQASSATLTAIGGLAVTDGNFIVGNGSTWVAESGDTARASLGLGSIATQSSGSVSITGGAINSTTVGATTPSTGAFTTLTTTGAATLASLTTTGAATLASLSTASTAFTGGYTENVFAITDGTTVNLDPNNGSIQTWTLGANRTPDQANWAAGQSITLMIDDGTARTITWTTLAVVWKTDGGVAPTLNTTGFTVIVLWKVGTTIYGARVGDA
jgi:hypothetical protein